MIRTIVASTMLHVVTSSLGPVALYNALSPLNLTLTSPGGETYEMLPYNDFKLITPTGNLTYGYFNDYLAFDNVYTYHLYTNGTADADCVNGRLADVTILCGQTNMIPAVIESPECEFHALLYTPWACGIDYTVGNENVAASPSPSQSRTPSGTGTSTSSPIAFVTAFLSQSNTPSSTPSTSPLYMITAWPTTSPLHVSPTSSPLFFLTPYPSYDPNNGTVAGILIAPSQGGTTSTILGGVAVGGVALGAIGFIIKHFKNGGTVGGLFKIALANKDKIQATLSQVPGAGAALNKVMNDPNAKKLMAIAQNPNSAIDQLAIPDQFKQSLRSVVPTSQEDLMKIMQDPSLLKSRVTSTLPPEMQQLANKLMEARSANQPIPIGSEISSASVPSTDDMKKMLEMFQQGQTVIQEKKETIIPIVPTAPVVSVQPVIQQTNIL
jgi:hypothetical protein